MITRRALFASPLALLLRNEEKTIEFTQGGFLASFGATAPVPLEKNERIVIKLEGYKLAEAIVPTIQELTRLR